MEEGDDTQSTTSWEDMSKLDPNMLLFKAAQARNLTVMLEALANGANPNWVNEDEEGRTPLMKAVETVGYVLNINISHGLFKVILKMCYLIHL